MCCSVTNWKFSLAHMIRHIRESCLTPDNSQVFSRIFGEVLETLGLKLFNSASLGGLPGFFFHIEMQYSTVSRVKYCWAVFTVFMDSIFNKRNLRDMGMEFNKKKLLRLILFMTSLPEEWMQNNVTSHELFWCLELLFSLRHSGNVIRVSSQYPSFETKKNPV